MKIKSLFVGLVIGTMALTPAFAQTDRQPAGERDNQHQREMDKDYQKGEKFLRSGQMDDIMASDLMDKSIYVTGTDQWEGAAQQRQQPGAATTQQRQDTGAATTQQQQPHQQQQQMQQQQQRQDMDPATRERRERRTMTVTERPDDWEDAGNVSDVILTRDGEIRGVLVDVGGFLGIGARSVAIDWDALKIVDTHDEEDFYLVLTTTREELENAPEYQHYDTENGMVRDTAPGTVRHTAPGVGQRTAPAEGYTPVEPRTISVDDLKGASVYDANHEDVASIDEVRISPEGEVQQVLLDVGGWLGIGARTVAIDIDQLDIHRDREGDVRVYVNMTEAELRQLPEYRNN